MKGGKAVDGKGHRLPDKTIDKLREYSALWQSNQKKIEIEVKILRQKRKSMHGAIKNMQDAIFAVFYHCVNIVVNRKGSLFERR